MIENARTCLTEVDPGELIDIAVASGGKPFHGKMLRKWLYANRAASFSDMTDLSLAVRRNLEKRYTLRRLTPAAVRRSKDGTVKYAYRLADDNIVETVSIPSRSRTTLCLSSQVGCVVGCRFCASGLEGFARNLTQGEIVEQFLLAAADSPFPVSNIVFMGTGEPLLNFDNLAKALHILNHPKCIGFGARRITVSTIGLPEKILRLAGIGIQVNLAVSLHAPDDEKRRLIVPAAEKIKISSILEAAEKYRKETTRDVTFEYILLGGFNDSVEDAEKLARLLKGTRCMVNLIAWNKVPGIDFRPPASGNVQQFLKTLREKRIPVTVWRSRGRDIEAACGQLRLVTH